MMKKLIALLALLPALALAQYVGPIYKPGSVAITGGTINGTTIGATTATTGRLSTLTMTAGGITWVNDNTYNFGAIGTGRPANVYVGSSINAGTSVNGATGVFSSSVTAASVSVTGGGLTWVNDNTYNLGAVGSGRPANAYIGGSINFGGAMTAPGLVNSSAATSGTLCWTTGTGNVTVNATVACLASAARFKQAVVPLDAGIDTLMKLRPVSYELKPEYDADRLGRQVGLIAEEVAKVDKRLVQYAPDGQTQGVRYMQLTAMLIKGAQEQDAQINRLHLLIALQFGLFVLAGAWVLRKN